MLTYKGHVECVCALVLSPVRLLSTPWAVAHQAPLSVGFPRQEYWSRLPFSSPGDLPNPGIKPASFMSPTCHGTAKKKKKIIIIT